MKNWILSLDAAITFSVLALLTETWRGFLDAMFVLPVDFDDPALIESFAIIYTLLFAAWAGSLIVAAQGRRWGLWAAFIINGLILLAIPVSWHFFYCPAACQAEAGIFNLANTLNLVFGILAAGALGVQLLRPTQVVAAAAA